MKILLLFILCSVLSAAAQPNVSRAPYVAGVLKPAAAAGAAYPGFSYDVVEDFENALAGLWSETDTMAVLNPQDTAAEYTSNGGAQGMSIASGTTAEAFVTYTPAAPLTTISLGFWYKTGTRGNFDGPSRVLKIYNGGAGTVVRLSHGADDTATRKFTWNLDGDTVDFPDATWCWVTIKFVKNSTTTCNIYNTSFAQVGSTMSATASNNDLDELRFGFTDASAAVSSSALYYDEIYLDTTDQTFPLGPAQ